jgi:uncharacterized protein (TIGR02145 family)
MKKIFTIPAIVLVLLFISIVPACKKKSSDNPAPPPATVTDVDGNVYHTIKIGTQEWMVENLKTTRYNNGVQIPLVTDNSVWSTLTTPGYCWYNNNAADGRTTYGALYNGYAVHTGRLAPTGWHVPSTSDWYTLIDYLGGTGVAGGKLKSVGTLEEGTGYWNAPNTGASNESGFTAVPAGYRDFAGLYDFLGVESIFWTTTVEAWPYCVSIINNHEWVEVNGNDDNTGFSVRCVKD